MEASLCASKQRDNPGNSSSSEAQNLRPPKSVGLDRGRAAVTRALNAFPKAPLWMMAPPLAGTNGTEAAAVALLGNYMAGSFVMRLTATMASLLPRTCKRETMSCR